MAKKKKKKKKIPEPTRVEVLVRNKKKLEKLIEHYNKDSKRLKLAIREYKKKLRIINTEINNLKDGD